ncbi:MAG: response regulator [Candidatus Dadabacteria bacterium]
MNHSLTYIIHVDDDNEDVELFKETVELLDPDISIKAFAEADVALNFIEQPELKVKPSLFVLDINMPRIDGKSLLRSIRKQPSLCHTPVVFFTTSSSHFDRDFALSNDVTFIQKPSSYSELKQAVNRILEFV